MSKLPWKFIRKAILKRDGRKCRKCGTDQSLTVHHVKPRAQGGSDDFRNLVTLCASCHDWAEITTAEEGLGWRELLRPPHTLHRVWYRDAKGYISALVLDDIGDEVAA